MRLLTCLVGILLCYSTLANDTFVLSNKHLEETIYLENYNCLSYSVTDGDSLNFAELNYSSIQNQPLKRLKAHKTYCFKFTIENQSHNTKWILEHFDFHIGKLRVFDAEGSQEIKPQGYNTSFFNRIFRHKNPVFNLEIPRGASKTYYISANTEVSVKHEFRVRSVEYFASYAFTEYFLLGIYYGILLIMIVYFTLLYFPLRTPLYLSFSLFIFSVALYSFSRDGLGFQYIWPSFPQLNYYSYYYSPLFFLICYTAYTHQFINLKKEDYKLWLINWGVISVFILIYTIDLSIKSDNNLIYFLPIPIFFVYYACIKSLLKGTIFTKYFFIGSSLIVVGTTLFMLNSINILPNNIITVYGTNLAVLIDVLVMALALSDRITIIRKAKEMADKKLILQLQETSTLKDKINEELEGKVQLRTQQLDDKVKELDVLNHKLEEQMEIINKMNSTLDLDNYNLKKKVEQTTKSRFLNKEVSYEEFQSIFPDQISCIRHLASIKWAKGYTCTKCGNGKYTNGKQAKSRRCTKCGYDETSTANTVFSGTKIPLEKAFYLTYKIYITKGACKITPLAKELDINPSTAKYFKDRILSKSKNSNTPIDDLLWQNIMPATQLN